MNPKPNDPRDAALEADLRWLGRMASAGPIDEPNEHARERTVECSSMTRLEELARNPESRTPLEQTHLAGCTRCGSRLRAFRRTDATSTPVRPVRRMAPWLRVAAAAAAIVVVALLVDTMIQTVEREPRRGRSVSHDTSLSARPSGQTSPFVVPVAGTSAREPVAGVAVGRSGTGSDEGCEQVSIRYLPANKSDGERVDHFELFAEEDCVVLVLMRTWDEDCACLRWRVHSWLDREGCLDPRRTLKSGESITLPVDVSNMPPCEHAVMVATARHLDELPIDFTEAAAVADCMEGSAPDGTPDADVVAMLSGAPSCFPREVSLCGESFSVR